LRATLLAARGHFAWPPQADGAEARYEMGPPHNGVEEMFASPGDFPMLADQNREMGRSETLG